MAWASPALYFGETFARIFLPDIVRYLPFDVAQSMVTTGSTTGGGGFGGGGAGANPLDPNVALVLGLVWLVGVLAVAAIFTERAEITG